MTAPVASQTVVTRAEIEDFLYHEAALLDEWRLDEWQQLLTEDAGYYVPSNEAPLSDHHRALFLIADDRERIRQRVIRVLDPDGADDLPVEANATGRLGVGVLGQKLHLSRHAVAALGAEQVLALPRAGRSDEAKAADLGGQPVREEVRAGPEGGQQRTPAVRARPRRDVGADGVRAIGTGVRRRTGHGNSHDRARRVLRDENANV